MVIITINKTKTFDNIYNACRNDEANGVTVLWLPLTNYNDIMIISKYTRGGHYPRTCTSKTQFKR